MHFPETKASQKSTGVYSRNFTDSDCFESAAFVQDVVNNRKSMKSVFLRLKAKPFLAKYHVTIFVTSSVDKTSVCVLRTQEIGDGAKDKTWSG